MLECIIHLRSFVTGTDHSLWQRWDCSLLPTSRICHWKIKLSQWSIGYSMAHPTPHLSPHTTLSLVNEYGQVFHIFKTFYFISNTEDTVLSGKKTECRWEYASFHLSYLQTGTLVLIKVRGGWAFFKIKMQIDTRYQFEGGGWNCSIPKIYIKRATDS